MIHDLKIWPEFFEEVLADHKKAEIRTADRPFAVGDTLRLQEWIPKASVYTGREVMRTITHISAPFQKGDSCDFVVLSIAPEICTRDAAWAAHAEAHGRANTEIAALKAKLDVEVAIAKANSDKRVAVEQERDQLRADLATLLSDTAKALGCNVDNEAILHKVHDLRAEVETWKEEWRKADSQLAPMKAAWDKQCVSSQELTLRLEDTSAELARVTVERDVWIHGRHLDTQTLSDAVARAEKAEAALTSEKLNHKWTEASRVQYMDDARRLTTELAEARAKFDLVYPPLSTVEKLTAELAEAEAKARRRALRGLAQFVRPVTLDEWSAAAKRLPEDATVLKICNEIIEARKESHGLKDPATNATEVNIQLLFDAVHKMQAQIGELQLQVQKLETGHRDDEPAEIPVPPAHVRYKFQSKHLRCATTCDQGEHDQLRLELDSEPVIPEKNLVVGGLYEVIARNLRLTVWTGKAFAGVRHKMGSVYLATETPYERNGSCDTAKPYLLVGNLPPGISVEDDKALFDYLWKMEGLTK